ncbi:MAG: dienelactone hydrolase family protein [Pseudomonadota bacterium]
MKDPIDPKVIALYDEYCHGFIDRREFFKRATAISATAVAMAHGLLPRYAEAQQVSFTDQRIKARYVNYDSPGGNSGKMRGYLVAPAGEGPFPALLVIHENRGLNPHIEDVARRFALDGFLALAPDGLAPVGGYPGNDDDGRQMQRALDQDKLREDMFNSARWLSAHELATDKLGITGFCWGGFVTNYLSARMGDTVAAAVPFYGSGVQPEAVAGMRAPLMIQAAENDPRINAAWPEFEAALIEHDVTYVRYVYPGTNHGFHNNSTPRYDEAAAKLAYERSVAFLKDQMG